MGRVIDPVGLIFYVHRRVIFYPVAIGMISGYGCVMRERSGEEIERENQNEEACRAWGGDAGDGARPPRPALLVCGELGRAMRLYTTLLGHIDMRKLKIGNKNYEMNRID